MDDVSSLILGDSPKYSVKDVQNMVYGQESSFGKANTSTPNYAGAQGPMQVTGKTFEGLKKKGLIPKEYNISNPEHNIAAGNALIADAYSRLLVVVKNKKQNKSHKDLWLNLKSL